MNEAEVSQLFKSLPAGHACEVYSDTLDFESEPLIVCLLPEETLLFLFRKWPIGTNVEKGGDVVQLVQRRTDTPLTQVRFPGAARDFSLRVIFQHRLFFGVRTPPCTIACIYICAHVKDPVVHVRVLWIMKTLKHPACTVGWVARLCRLNWKAT